MLFSLSGSSSFATILAIKIDFRGGARRDVHH